MGRGPIRPLLPRFPFSPTCASRSAPLKMVEMLSETGSASVCTRMTRCPAVLVYSSAACGRAGGHARTKKGEEQGRSGGGPVKRCAWAAVGPLNTGAEGVTERKQTAPSACNPPKGHAPRTAAAGRYCPAAPPPPPPASLLPLSTRGRGVGWHAPFTNPAPHTPSPLPTAPFPRPYPLPCPAPARPFALAPRTGGAPARTPRCPA